MDPTKTKDDECFICKLLYFSNTLRGGEKNHARARSFKMQFQTSLCPLTSSQTQSSSAGPCSLELAATQFTSGHTSPQTS